MWEQVRGTRAGAGKYDGFTIVELMITLLIMAILVTMVVMTMVFSRGKAQQSACKANLRTIDSAVQLYMSLHDGEAPPKLETLMPEYIKGSFDWKCPSGNGDYLYDSSTGQTSCPRADHNP